MAAITRHWSTYLNGIQTDEAKFRGEIDQIVQNVKATAASPRRQAGGRSSTAPAALADIAADAGLRRPSSSSASRTRPAPAPGAT